MRERDDSRPTIVSIIGPAGSGKSQLAKATAALLGEDVATRVPTDYFFIPRTPEVPLGDFLHLPLIYDWALLDRALTQPPGTIVTTPDADFGAFVRRGETGGLPFTVRPLMLLDAMRPHPASDRLVRLDIPDAIRRARLAERDRRWQTNVLAKWDHLERTWRAGASDLARAPDLVLDATRPLAASAADLAVWLRQIFPSFTVSG